MDEAGAVAGGAEVGIMATNHALRSRRPTRAASLRFARFGFLFAKTLEQMTKS